MVHKYTEIPEHLVEYVTSLRKEVINFKTAFICLVMYLSFLLKNNMGKYINSCLKTAFMHLKAL